MNRTLACEGERRGQDGGRTGRDKTAPRHLAPHKSKALIKARRNSIFLSQNTRIVGLGLFRDTDIENKTYIWSEIDMFVGQRKRK